MAVDAVDSLFAKALRGDATVVDQQRFEAHMLMEMAAMSVDDGLVMQLHPGSLRDHNSVVSSRFGADKGADIPLRTEYTRNLRALLDAYGSDPRFRIVLFTLDTRAFCSIPARHDLARRVDANWLAGLVARHIVEMDEAHAMGRALAYELARDTYNVGPPARDDRVGAARTALAGATA